MGFSIVEREPAPPGWFTLSSYILNKPYTGRMIDWPNMGQTDHILAVNGLELESSVHGQTNGPSLIGRI